MDADGNGLNEMEEDEELHSVARSSSFLRILRGGERALKLAKFVSKNRRLHTTTSSIGAGSSGNYKKHHGNWRQTEKDYIYKITEQFYKKGRRPFPWPHLPALTGGS